MRVERDGYAFDVTDGPGGSWFWTTYYLNEWEHEQRNVFAAMPPGGLFLDLGAWIGPWTLPALARGLRVVAYEPDPVAFGELMANVSANRSDHVTVLHPHAVTVTATSVALRSEAAGWGGSESGRWANGTVTLTVEGVPLAPVLAALQPDMVKMDVEGDELDLLPIVAEAGVPCHVSLHAPLAQRAGVEADFEQLRPAFARYGRLIVDGKRRATADTVPVDRFCSITCLEPQ